MDKPLPIVTTAHATEELSLRGFTNLQQLDKWESISFVMGNMQLLMTATAERHGPLPVAMFLPEVMGSMLDFRTRYNPPRHMLWMYITGDT